MPEHGQLGDLVVVLAAAILGVVLLHRVRLPAIAGLLLAGALVGPTGLGLIEDAEAVEMAERLIHCAILHGIGAMTRRALRMTLLLKEKRRPFPWSRRFISPDRVSRPGGIRSLR